MGALITNRKASFNYDILERFDAGLELFGGEVKSVRLGQGSLEGSYIIIRGGEAWLQGMFIPPYKAAGGTEGDPMRLRKLLLTKEEIRRLSDLEKGLTIIPISVYNKKRWIKVEIATARGKKNFDKRETIKKRDTARQLRREHIDR
jgi:SsrA-binding protein